MKQYEMAFRMQTSVPEVMDVADEPDYIFDLYGKDSKTPGTFAANCLLARKLIEKNVKFVQLYHKVGISMETYPIKSKSNVKILIRLQLH